MTAYGTDSTARRDDGLSLIEVILSITLLGLVMASMLTTLAVTVSASATERDHANAHAWLQSATDVLYGAQRIDCDDPTLEDGYRAVIAATQDPEGWWEAANPGSIELVSPVLFWDGDIYQGTCYDDQNVNLQLLKLRVVNPAGDVVETVEVVKG